MGNTSTATWHAFGSDGVGHAFLAGAAGVRSLCGDVRRLELRFDHPITDGRHEVCTAELNRRLTGELRDGDQVGAGLTELENRYAWGDR